MIADQAHALSRLLRENRQLEDAQNDAKTIAATYNALIEVAATAKSLSDVAITACHYLTADQRHQIKGDLAGLQARVCTLHESFSSQPKQQSLPLGTLRKEIEATHEKIDVSWRTHAQTRVKPHLDLLNLVHTLPEVQQQTESLNTLRMQLQSAQQKAPRQAPQIASLHAAIQALDERLGSLVNLSPVVREFLYRVRDGQATLNDLSDEVLAWCKLGTRMTAFRIQFAQDRG